MDFVPLIELTRGGMRESLHFGAVAVADARGRLVAAAGNPHLLAFTRSTLKALQALPFVQSGGPQRLGFTPRQLALLCASHNGEPMHVQEVQGMLDKAGLNHRHLQCGCQVPLFVEFGVGPAPAQVDERHHNCSGKHAGFLAHCVDQGLPLDTYLDPLHPLQRDIRRALAAVAGVDEAGLRMGTDGCSAPNYAMPLSALASAYARLASAARDGAHDDRGFGDAFVQLAGAMTAHPDLVSGTHRNDEAFMRAGGGDWVTKIGADGMQVVASRSRAQALAIKVSDGNARALHAATVDALEQLGWLDDAQRAALAPWRATAITSMRGVPVGERRAVFRLQPA